MTEITKMRVSELHYSGVSHGRKYQMHLHRNNEHTGIKVILHFLFDDGSIRSAYERMYFVDMEPRQVRRNMLDFVNG